MKRKFFLCLTFIFFLTPYCIFAKSGKKTNEFENVEQDLSLFEIDRLIRKTEYDEALRQLNVYIEKNPENFDNAQIRIRRIMTARKQYSILAEKLIDLILNDPNNNKEIYEITAQLEKFERHPSDQNLQFIADLKKSAEFNYFRSLFLEIQTQSAELTKKGLYYDAIVKTQEGFWLYKDNFYVKWEDNPEILTKVDAILDNLNTQIQTYGERNFLNNFQKSVDAFVEAVNKDQYDTALTLCYDLTKSLSGYIAIRNEFINCGVQIQSLFEEIQKIDEDSSDASFLPFMNRFILGIDTVPESGIAGAVNGQWNKYMSQMNEAVYEQLTKKYTKFLENPLEDGNTQVELYCKLENNLLALNNVLIEGGVDEIKAGYEHYIIAADYLISLSAQTVQIMNVMNAVQKESGVQNGILANLQKQSGEERSAAIKALFDSNAKIGDLVGVKAQQEIEAFDWASKYTETGYSDWISLTNFYTETLTSIFDTSSKLLNDSWLTLSQYYKDSADEKCKLIQTHNNNSEKYYTGFFTKIPENIHSEIMRTSEKAFMYVNTFEQNESLNFGVYYSYPDITLEAALYTQSEVDRYINEITEYQNILESNYKAHEQWTFDENITEIVMSAKDYLEKDKANLLELKSKSADFADSARNSMVAAQLAQNEADLRFAEAEAALSRDNFELARKKLQDAVAKYDESLKNQDSAQLQRDVDNKLFNLGERITKSENETVVREVRQLKNAAKDAYLNGRFDDAEKYLNEAKIRWAVTNATEDGEIINLMNFVNTAISMKTGREILPSAPQYPEMSQLLNIANQYYESGTDKIKKGDSDGGNSDLNLALQNTQKVQYTYPLNRDASLLTLKINKQRDAKKFNEELSQKIELAKMMCQRKDSQQEGYANLLDYYDIEPNYKGLKELIYQVEIDIGIRQKPVDNSGAKRAEKLFAEAQKLFKSAGDDPVKLEAALAKVDESIMLHSDNDAALNLKDQITIKIGGNTSVTLSTDDERLYRSAIAKLQANDIFGANIIVQELLKNPRNAKSQQIKDLKSKVDARL